MTLPCPARGIFDHGYTFLENELPALAAQNGRLLDSLFVGSSRRVNIFCQWLVIRAGKCRSGITVPCCKVFISKYLGAYKGG
jgi:hypothetical protein